MSKEKTYYQPDISTVRQKELPDANILKAEQEKSRKNFLGKFSVFLDSSIKKIGYGSEVDVQRKDQSDLERILKTFEKAKVSCDNDVIVDPNTLSVLVKNYLNELNNSWRTWIKNPWANNEVVNRERYNSTVEFQQSFPQQFQYRLDTISVHLGDINQQLSSDILPLYSPEKDRQKQLFEEMRTEVHIELRNIYDNAFQTAVGKVQEAAKKANLTYQSEEYGKQKHGGINLLCRALLTAVSTKKPLAPFGSYVSNIKSLTDARATPEVNRYTAILNSIYTAYTQDINSIPDTAQRYLPSEMGGAKVQPQIDQDHPSTQAVETKADKIPVKPTTFEQSKENKLEINRPDKISKTPPVIEEQKPNIKPIDQVKQDIENFKRNLATYSVRPVKTANDKLVFEDVVALSDFLTEVFNNNQLYKDIERLYTKYNEDGFDILMRLVDVFTSKITVSELDSSISKNFIIDKINVIAQNKRNGSYVGAQQKDICDRFLDRFSTNSEKPREPTFYGEDLFFNLASKKPNLDLLSTHLLSYLALQTNNYSREWPIKNRNEAQDFLFSNTQGLVTIAALSSGTEQCKALNQLIAEVPKQQKEKQQKQKQELERQQQELERHEQKRQQLERQQQELDHLQQERQQLELEQQQQQKSDLLNRLENYRYPMIVRILAVIVWCMTYPAVWFGARPACDRFLDKQSLADVLIGILNTDQDAHIKQLLTELKALSAEKTLPNSLIPDGGSSPNSMDKKPAPPPPSYRYQFFTEETNRNLAKNGKFFNQVVNPPLPKNDSDTNGLQKL